MIGRIIKYSIYIVIILLIFAFLPEEILNKLKLFFNWDVFLNTLKKGFNKLVNFLEENIGIDFDQIFIKIKEALGIDIPLLFKTIKNTLANFFQNLANILK
jgi:hypothetical protein